MKIEFFVEGIPKPGGSKNGFYSKKLNRVLIVDASKNKDWRLAVETYARDAYQGKPLEGPLKLTVTFLMPRPKHHYNAKGGLKPTAPLFHIGKPDTTKLLRSTEDSLKGIVWKDDCLVCIQTAAKFYATEVAGAEIVIETLEDGEP